jgi:hypothetical protein
VTTTRYLHIPDTPDGVTLATDTILGAMSEDARHPVTVGYFETRKEWRHPKRGTGPAKWYPVKGQYVHTVRTVEFYGFGETTDGPDSGVFFEGIDRCPLSDTEPPHPLTQGRTHTAPAIRRVCARRITDLTVHRQITYHYPNQYFIDSVRAHAIAWGRPDVSSLTGDAIWHKISLATDTDDALRRAGLGAHMT